MKRKKAIRIGAIVVGGLLLGAVVLGVLNALIADGEWTFGWSNYRYDDSAYSIGDGTIYASDLTSISVDWIDGTVQIVSCGDTWISVTESTDQTLSEKSRMRWCVSEDGGTLSIKYRASSHFFGSSENKKKDLILRIPERMLSQLTDLKVNTVSSSVQLSDVAFERISIVSTSGDVSVTSSALPHRLDVNTFKGDILLTLPEDAAFRLRYDGSNGHVPSIDFPVETVDGEYLCGTTAPAAELFLQTQKGSVTVCKRKVS